MIILSGNFFGRKGSSLYLDNNAEIFLDAAGITDRTISLSMSEYISAHKRGGIWPMMYWDYVYVAANASGNAINVINPSLNPLTFVGTMTHAANGITGDGATGYARTGWNPVTAGIDRRNFAIDSYSTLGGIAYDMGVKDAVGNNFIGQLRRTAGVYQIARMASSGTPLISPGTAGYAASMRTTTTIDIVQAGVAVATHTEGTNYTDGAVPNLEMYLMTFNNNGIAGGKTFQRFCGHGAMLYLNTAQKLIRYNAVLNLNTALNRL